ncbi:RNA-binding domain-containing protein [Tilletiopsis washingtonensis]|uniref:RNA-binding domain-containing protein n=1 Tax=Tilletiopsis washingtonensis TaxID=58919 RepID=A0A316ZGK9_9BASI|nr:RNA-binding domain-containing protein [Tilletiopsis washingtonensis]PWO00387.1 RNA-binding domain-containing protein [Tilletiopsis washingtonensis]
MAEVVKADPPVPVPAEAAAAGSAGSNPPATTAPAKTPQPPKTKNLVSPEDAPKQVFAGNLAFATTEAELKEIFAAAGTVTQAQIIMRGTRSLGYGFVTYSSEAEAHKAVELLNKKEIAGREINVEGAKPQAAAPAEKPATAAAGEAEKDGAAARGASTRGRGRGRGRGGRGGATAARRPRADEGEEGLDEATDAAAAPAAAAENGEAAAAKPKKNRKSKAAKAAANGDAAPAADGAAAAPAAAKPPKPQRAKGEAPVGAPSKTLLFVANLPFEFTDEQFKAVFEGGPEVVSAKVVKRPYSNKTKGFGFVDFKDEEGQQSALSNFNGKNVEGRDIVLKVAIQSQKPPTAAAAEQPEAGSGAVPKPEADAPAVTAI